MYRKFGKHGRQKLATENPDTTSKRLPERLETTKKRRPLLDGLVITVIPETSAPFPIAQLAPHPPSQPHILGGPLAVPDEGRKHQS
jgi:hypothetical protein